MFFFLCLTINIWDEIKRKYFFHKESKSLYHCTHHQSHCTHHKTQPLRILQKTNLIDLCLHGVHIQLTPICLAGLRDTIRVHRSQESPQHQRDCVIILEPCTQRQLQWRNLTSSPHKQGLSAIVESWENYLEPTWIAGYFKKYTEWFPSEEELSVCSQTAGWFLAPTDGFLVVIRHRKTNIIWYRLYVEPKKGYKWTYLQNRRKQTYGYQGGRGKGINWQIGIDIYVLLYMK